MLRKLMKYEFTAMGRIFLPLFGALIIVSIVNRLLANLPALAPVTIGRVLSGILIAGILVATLILILQRFRKNLLSDEGYLMMTLPVCTDRLILSKLFVAAICSVASFIVVTISILIMTFPTISWSEFIGFFEQLYKMIEESPLRTIVYTIEVILAGAVLIFSGILMLYACMSLSMLVNKRRGLFTFGAFIVISTGLQIIIAILASIVQTTNIGAWLSEALDGMSTFAQSQVIIMFVIVLELALCTGFYIITRFMLKNKLNLQ